MKTSFPKSKIKVLLLENIHQSARECFEEDGFSVEHLTHTLPEEELIKKLKDVRILGIRSATNLTEKVLKSAPNLLAVGCYCIGTNQVNKDAAEKLGIPVFNSPFCNSRSVAELIIAQIINLARQIGDANNQMHSGRWFKFSKQRFEIRGKTLGIVGYGNIGTQVSVLAESMGMKVIYYDIVKKLAIGNATSVNSLDELLRTADFVTLHVPETPDTKNMITKAELLKMKRGSYLLNASRGTVVNLNDLASVIYEEHLAGAYTDVYDVEPKCKNTPYTSVLQGLSNVILTPHIGGATEEAQHSIGLDVSSKLIKYVNEGSSDGAVNFPNVCAKVTPGTHRILNIHRNVPNVLKDINEILASSNYNISRQVLDTSRSVGYLIIDVNTETSDEIKNKIRKLEESIRTRILY